MFYSGILLDIVAEILKIDNPDQINVVWDFRCRLGGVASVSKKTAFFKGDQ